MNQKDTLNEKFSFTRYAFYDLEDSLKEGIGVETIYRISNFLIYYKSFYEILYGENSNKYKEFIKNYTNKTRNRAIHKYSELTPLFISRPNGGFVFDDIYDKDNNKILSPINDLFKKIEEDYKKYQEENNNGIDS